MERHDKVKWNSISKTLLLFSALAVELAAFMYYGDGGFSTFTDIACVTTLAYWLSLVVAIYNRAVIAAPRHDISEFYGHDLARRHHTKKGCLFVSVALCEVGTLLLLFFYPVLPFVAFFMVGLCVFAYQAVLYDTRIGAQVDTYSDW